MRNPLLQAAAEVANAINALRLKRHTLEANHEGVVIHQPGKPSLLLTYDAAREWAVQVRELEQQ